MQPTFIPWVGYFDLIDSVDKFIFYDDVQFSKQSWQSRNRIKTNNGVVWLSVPIRKHELNAKINKIEINNYKFWSGKLLKTIYFTYSKERNFDEIYNFFLNILSEREYTYLSDLSISIIKAICSEFKFDTSFLLSSDLRCLNDDRQERLIDICRKVGCSSYLSTKGSSMYIEETNEGGKFSRSGINLFYHEYFHPSYHQNFGDFISHMSIVDILFQEGFDNSLNIIRSGKRDFLVSRDL